MVRPSFPRLTLLGSAVLVMQLLILLQSTERADGQEHRELYERLGTDKTANARGIKRAFRKMSLKYHPDKNIGKPGAEAKFKEISEAYEILSDDEKRRVYDLEGMEGLEKKEKQGAGGGSPFDMFFGGGGGGGGQKGPNADVTIAVSLEDLYNGAERSARISRNVICTSCRGTGAKGGSMKKCKSCKGQGVRLVQQQMGPGFTVQMQQQCPRCGGKGSIIKHKCPACKGSKVLNEEKLLTADIERGMPSNHEIVFERESEQQPGVTPGDVIFKLKAEEHKRFRRVKNDLHHTMHITLKEALLGFSKDVQQLDDRMVTVANEGVTKPFQVIKIKDEGMPHYEFPSDKGTLHVKIIVDFPKVLTSEQRGTIEQLLRP